MKIHEVYREQIAFVREQFGEMKDGSGTLISDHAVRVFQILSDTFTATGRPIGEEERAMLAAALFHDLLEDTPTSEEDLQRRGGERCLELVRELTIDFKGRSIDETVGLMKSRSEASFLIKLCDISDNFCKTRFVFRNNEPTFFTDFFLPLMQSYRGYIGYKMNQAREFKPEISLLAPMVERDFRLLEGVVSTLL
jgi:(p)ppGpp synthase/HD superfamily hydrolase